MNGPVGDPNEDPRDQGVRSVEPRQVWALLERGDARLLDLRTKIEAVVELGERVCDPRTRRACGAPRPSPPSA
jgi:hypothetical protein